MHTTSRVGTAMYLRIAATCVVLSVPSCIDPLVEDPGVAASAAPTPQGTVATPTDANGALPPALQPGVSPTVDPVAPGQAPGTTGVPVSDTPTSPGAGVGSPTAAPTTPAPPVNAPATSTSTAPAASSDAEGQTPSEPGGEAFDAGLPAEESDGALSDGGLPPWRSSEDSPGSEGIVDAAAPDVGPGN